MLIAIASTATGVEAFWKRLYARAISDGARAWFASDMSATSTSVYTCTNNNGEVAVDEDKC